MLLPCETAPLRSNARRSGLGLVVLLFLVGDLSLVRAQSKVLNAVFTPAPIKVDAQTSDAWAKAAPSGIGICMDPPQKAERSDCAVTATVQALWNGPVLYLLFAVTDPDISVASPADTKRSSVQIYVDQYDDKFPKFEEDDGTITISAAGQQTGNHTNADLPYYPTIWATHLISSSAAYRTDAGGKKIGYTVEVAWQIGDRPLRNGTKIGMEFAINAASSSANDVQYRVLWNDGKDKGTDDNTTWGDVELTGYDSAIPMPLNTFLLEQRIRQATPSDSSATGLVRGIWKDETAVDRALAAAKDTMKSPMTQAKIDAATSALTRALRGLRRTGKYPDPLDLKPVNTLPDPFTFFNGKKVRTRADWDRRRAEIIDLAEYYEFGAMPPKPQSVTAVSTPGADPKLESNDITVTVEDNGKTASIKPILYLPKSGTPPYPVIVEEDFAASPRFAPPNPAYLDDGYAILSVPTWDSARFNFSGIASDDGNHTGAFFTLYPYKLDAAGDDRGVLLAWAWGASRSVDALEYLVAHDPAYAHLVDVKKLVVAGFSRWGKAALLAGMLDERFLVTAPRGSGSGGAAPYRYDSFGNRPFRSEPFGNVYPWGKSPGSEAMADHVRHQTHNSNEMIRRFLNDPNPTSVEPRMYFTDTWGYGDRLPYDHHEEIAAIAPRAVFIENTNDDYADNAEGDSIGYEGAKPVFAFMGAEQNLALDLYMGGGGHSLKKSQAEDLVRFADMVLFNKPLAPEVKAHLATDPYLGAGTYDKYYGGLKMMMPWGAELAGAATAQQSPGPDLLAALTADFDKLAPQTVMPAQGYIHHDYLVPAGYYPQMWDWDGFFIGSHWANQDPANTKYLRDWVVSFASSADADGYVAGCITPKGPRPLFGKFAMKPFLAQGAVLAANQLSDYEWIRPVWPAMQRVLDYRKKTQFDTKWNLWFWDNALQSGADNSPALTNDTNDRSAILAVDASVWAMREYQAMAVIARHLGDKTLVAQYDREADATRKAIMKNLWRGDKALFLNRRRDTGAWMPSITWSSFVPLAFGMLPQADGARMIRMHLLNPAEMRSLYGFRSVAKTDPAYNNDAIIDPYSNWRGPIWINANYLDWLALRRYGFNDEAKWLAGSLATILHNDIKKWGSMHEDYDAETGFGLAPTVAQSPNGKFAGFVGWNMLAQDMLQCEQTGNHCTTFRLEP